jgi:hypothetical protein
VQIDPTNFIKTSEGRQAIMQKLKTIRLDRVAFDSVPLREVIRTLVFETKKHDPDGQGINYLLNPNQPGVTPKIDPGTGLAVATNAVLAADLRSLPITINPPLTNITLGDALDALVKVAPEQIQYSVVDYGIIFSPGRPAEPFYERVFKVHTNTFYNGLKNATGLQTNNVSTMAGSYFKTLGVDFDLPRKSVAYDDRNGLLFVRATETDLDTIERAIDVLNTSEPQIHIKARFIEVTQDDGKASGFDWYLGHFGSNNVTGKAGGSPSLAVPVSAANPLGVFSSNTTSSTGGQQYSARLSAPVTGILTDTNLRVVLYALQQRGKSEVLGEPEVTTTSGRRTIMKATSIVSNVTGFTYQGTATNSGITPQIVNVEFGPFLESTATVLADGFTIDLSMDAGLVYETTTNAAVADNKTRKKINSPVTLPNIHIPGRVNVKVWDNQTVVLGGMITPSSQTTKDKGLS